MEHFHTVLGNGIQLLHQPIPNDVAHCGILIRTGSRDEARNEHGMAHFIEHTIFKGTEKRNLYHILNRLEHVGGELNAYTTKEFTCIYASFLHEHYERALELIADITFHSIFPQKEIEKEKDVVIDEINSYKDNPSEEIFDEFEDILFHGHPLGRNILGSISSVTAFQREDILSFLQKNYHTDHMLISSAGNIAEKKLQHLAEKHFSLQIPNHRTKARKPFRNYVPFRKRLKKSNFQVHCMIGNIAYASADERRYPLSLMNNILGGPGMNSRLSLAIRERHGYAYNIESNYGTYSDTGFFAVYLGTDPQYLDVCQTLIHKELDKLRKEKLSPVQLKRAKDQFRGQMAIGWEQNLSRMLGGGKSMMLLGKLESWEEIVERLDKITADDLLNVANEVLDPGTLSTLIYEIK